VSEESRGDPGDFTVGSVVAGYRLEGQIGQGGMAVVFRAHDPRLDRRVALKIMAPGLAHDDAFRQRFIRESRAAAAVDDPHIIPVYEAGEADGVLFIAMRFVRGGDVRSLLDREGPLPPARAVDIVAQVASALDSAHAIGLVHRDVKPANMLLDAGAGSGGPDHVYLSDFGLTKTSLAATGLTGTGQFLGTLDYVAPEQIQGRPVDGRADLYALACATFELLTGAPPFRRDQDMAVMYAQVTEAPPSLSSRRSDLPAAADAVMNRALAKAPEDRPASCREFATGLRQALGLDPAGPGAGAQAPAWPPTQIAAPILPPPPTRVSPAAAASHPAERETTPGPTDPSAWSQRDGGAGPPRGGYGPPPGAGRPGGHEEPAGAGRPPGTQARGSGRPGWPWWRSPVLAAVAFVVIAAAVGGYFLFSRGGTSAARAGGSPSHHGGSHSHHGTAVTSGLLAPGCTTSTPRLTTLGTITSQEISIGGTPFAALESDDGRYTFVTAGNRIAVLSNNGGLSLTLLRTVPVPGADKALNLTGDGRYLVAAGGRGAVVVSVAAAEQGTGNPVVGRLTSPHGSGAVGVLLSPDGKYLFVTLQNSTTIAVFNFALAAASGFSTSGFTGFIPLGDQPVGMHTSLDGKWLYATSFRRTPGRGPGEGTLSVINLATAETSPAKSVRTTVNAGCSPARIQTQGNTNTVWVTARDSNALLGFSASKLLSDPAHALLAVVPVGPGPIGLTPLSNDRFVIADSNYASPSHAAGELAVVSTANALGGKPAVLGVIPAGGQPHQLTQSERGTVLLVTNQVTGQLQAITIADLP
jgi:hypothetical protein